MFNPALLFCLVAFGLIVVHSIFHSVKGWSYLWIYIVGPLLGGVIAFVVYKFLINEPEKREKESKYSDILLANEYNEICQEYSDKGHLLALAHLHGWGLKGIVNNNKMHQYALEYYEKNKDKISEDKKRNQLMGYCLWTLGKSFKIKNDETNSLEFYNKAIEVSENPLSLYDLGFMHHMIRDLNRAVDHYTRSADLGYCLAYYQLGELNYKEEAKDINKSIEYFKKAAEYEIHASLRVLAQIYKELNDQNLAANYMLLYIRRGSISLYQKRSLDTFFDNFKAEWREEFHPYWKFSQNKQEQIDSKIVYLLLISKHRKEVKSVACQVMIKGITMNIIKFLCQFTQK